MNEELILLSEIERYLEGAMSEAERAAFEAKRRNDPSLDQQVVEHLLLCRQLQAYGERRALRLQLNRLHSELDLAAIKECELPAPRKILLSRHILRTMAVAASVALLTAAGTLGIYLSMNKSNNAAQYTVLKRELESIRHSQNVIIKNMDAKSKLPASPGSFAGTGFAISNNGYLATNYHLINGGDSIYVQDSKGNAYKVKTIYQDPNADLAILKIIDSTYKQSFLPYTLSTQPASLGEEVYTLGYPRDEIVYGKGYISAQTGFGGDTLSYQVAIPVNPGNSGGPLMDSQGQLIGIISGKQTSADGFAFAIKSSHLVQLLDELPEGHAIKNTKPKKNMGLDHLSRIDQIKKMQDYIFLVKVYK